MPYQQGDEVRVVSPNAPRYGLIGEFIRDLGKCPYPCEVQFSVDGRVRLGVYEAHELEKVDADATTQEIPVVTA